MIMFPDEYLRNGKVCIWKETFAIIKSKTTDPDSLAIIKDKKETTLVIDQSKFKEDYVIEIEKGWKLLTFDMILPFDLVGFLAKISKALADENITIFTLSAYSTDHILVKEKDLEKTQKKLESLGCIVEKL